MEKFIEEEYKNLLISTDPNLFVPFLQIDDTNEYVYPHKFTRKISDEKEIINFFNTIKEWAKAQGDHVVISKKLPSYCPRSNRINVEFFVLKKGTKYWNLKNPENLLVF